MDYLKKTGLLILAGVMGLSFASCTDDDDKGGTEPTSADDENYIGKAVGNFSAEEWYAGGLLG
ncbi:MAG: hypothetical protein II447_12280, partial [Bacteroidaceae bacterium]|nr:hypothetical protein [Bacteroidaceae bacterium]